MDFPNLPVMRAFHCPWGPELAPPHRQSACVIDPILSVLCSFYCPVSTADSRTPQWRQFEKFLRYHGSMWHSGRLLVHMCASDPAIKDDRYEWSFQSHLRTTVDFIFIQTRSMLDALWWSVLNACSVHLKPETRGHRLGAFLDAVDDNHVTRRALADRGLLAPLDHWKPLFELIRRVRDLSIHHGHAPHVVPSVDGPALNIQKYSGLKRVPAWLRLERGEGVVIPVDRLLAFLFAGYLSFSHDLAQAAFGQVDWSRMYGHSRSHEHTLIAISEELAVGILGLFGRFASELSPSGLLTKAANLHTPHSGVLGESSQDPSEWQIVPPGMHATFDATRTIGWRLMNILQQD